MVIADNSFLSQDQIMQKRKYYLFSRYFCVFLVLLNGSVRVAYQLELVCPIGLTEPLDFQVLH
jgi:hypothetical protein